MKKTAIFLFLSLFVFALTAFAQPRVAERPDPNAPDAPKPAAAPASFDAKYEGGVFGYSKREEGTLKFDDANQRLVFFGKDSKEKLSIPYKAMLVIQPQAKSVQSNTGTVVSHIPLPGAGLLGSNIKEKHRYLVINYDDPDVAVRGLVNFKLSSRELLESVIFTLGEKAKLKQRGDAFYRPSKFETRTVVNVKEI